ncbi:hypothetical protein N0V85_003687, partial [Neurospora sp. IMI 360204]
MASTNTYEPIEEMNAIHWFVDKNKKLPKQWDPELLLAVMTRKQLSKPYETSNHPVLKNLHKILKSLNAVRVNDKNKL